MHRSTTWLCGGLVLGSAGLAAMSLVHRPERAVGQSITLALSTPGPGRSSPSDFDGDCYQRLRQGADWLARNCEFEQEPDRLACGAIALGRAAQFTGSKQLAERARHLMKTRKRIDTDSLGSAGLFLLAIEETPTADRELLSESERLCDFIARRQQADGCFLHMRGLDDVSGVALYALARSERRQPGAWKRTVLSRACRYYVGRWRAQPSLALVPSYLQAYAEVYRVTREPELARAVTEMADWLCGQQYVTLDSEHPDWLGGFPASTSGASGAPTISSAQYAETLSAACRVAQQTGDAAHLCRYRGSLDGCLRFLLSLQYTRRETGRFADWYRPMLEGSFFDSNQDATPSTSGTEHAVAALATYLEEAAPMRRSVALTR